MEKNLSQKIKVGWKSKCLIFLSAIAVGCFGCASNSREKFLASGENNSYDKEALEKEQKDLSKRTPTTTPGAGHPTTSSSFNNDEFTRFAKLTPDKARAIYGDTVEGYFGRDIIFTLAPRGVEHPFRADLVAAVEQMGVDLSNTPVRVLEMTWIVDEFRLITIWFIAVESSVSDPKKGRSFSAHYSYAQHIVWNRFWNFDVECPEGTMTETQFLECQRGYRTNYYNGIQLRFEID